jgi:integrase
MSITKVTQPDGSKTYTVNFYYHDNQGNRKRKKKEGIKRHKDAVSFESAFKAEIENDCTLPFCSLFDEYLEDCRLQVGITLKETSYTSIKSIYNKHFKPELGNIAVNKITPDTIRKWHNSLLKAGYSQSSIRTYNTVLSTFFNHCVRYKNLSKNPVRLCQFRKQGTVKKEMHFWTLEQFNKFIATIDYIKRKTEYYLLFYSGVRIGELLALTISDVDRQNCTIDINKTYNHINKHDNITSPKTPSSYRIIALPPVICKMLGDYIDNQLYKPTPKERIFKESEEAINGYLKSHIDKTNLPKIRLHDFRHSHASMLINMGYNILTISHRLGHKDVATTLNIYGHLYPDQDSKIATDLDRIIK